MGIFCQINLNKPPDGAFYSGELVSGMIKYALDVPMEMEKITISLKGTGILRITERTSQKNRNRTYATSEVYVDTDEVIQEGKYTILPNSYEVKFNFRLPQNIPPTFDYHKYVSSYNVYCKIKYYVRIKFDRPGWFAFSKHFRKEITVASTITPKLSMEPVIYGERSKLLQLFSSKVSTVIMKADILNSIIKNGGKIEIESEIQNDTTVNIKNVEVKLLEMHTFKVKGLRDVKAWVDVPNCETKTGSVKSGATLHMPVDIIVPSDIVSLDNSNIVSRDYVVRITAALPMPHRNVVLDIPVQIGDSVQREEFCDPPPTYWEAMGESKKGDEDGSDDEAGGDEKGEKGEKS